MSAAVNGLGVAVAWFHLARDQLQQELLVRPLRDSYQIDRKHLLVWHRSRADDPVVQMLRAWFIEETACFRAGKD